jgi:hypothetical protein
LGRTAFFGFDGGGGPLQAVRREWRFVVHRYLEGVAAAPR